MFVVYNCDGYGSVPYRRECLTMFVVWVVVMVVVGCLSAHTPGD